MRASLHILLVGLGLVTCATAIAEPKEVVERVEGEWLSAADSRAQQLQIHQQFETDQRQTQMRANLRAAAMRPARDFSHVPVHSKDSDRAGADMARGIHQRWDHPMDRQFLESVGKRPAWQQFNARPFSAQRK
jgi:hypothetical protein